VILDSMNVDDRLAFTLRHLEGLELTEVAATLKMSLSTAKRRLWRAEAEFRRKTDADRDLRACFAERDGAKADLDAPSVTTPVKVLEVLR
jgi:RNA polymerase sigma-70 factor (ECF subfamily)